MKFLHSMIRVKDIDASLKFYTELLNMKIEKKKRLEDCELYFLNDEDNSGAQIELTYNDETPAEGYQCGNAFGHFAFAVESFDEFTKRLYSLGYKYLYEPFDLDGKGSIIAFVNDPDGNEIELVQKVVW